jgi:hypothetical protein
VQQPRPEVRDDDLALARVCRGSLSMYGKYSVHTIPSRVSVDQHAWAEQGQRERDSGPMDRIVMHLFVCWMLPSDGTPRVQEAWTYLVPDLV